MKFMEQWTARMKGVGFIQVQRIEIELLEGQEGNPIGLLHECASLGVYIALGAKLLVQIYASQGLESAKAIGLNLC